MHGVPDNLDLTALHGASMHQVTYRENSIEIVLIPDASPLWEINVEGGWELRDAFGSVIDQAMESHVERKVFYLWRLIAQRVTHTTVKTPEWFELTFENGSALRIIDDSKQYESFSIQPGDIYV